MKSYRVTIKYRTGENTGLISKTVPAYNERQAIDQIIAACKLAGKVVSEKAELLKLS